MTAVQQRDVARGVHVGAQEVFLGILLVVFAVYLQLALGMEWRTAAGRIGPGFFPRIVGGAGVVLTLAALVRSVRRGAPEAEADDRHPRTLAVVVAACAGLVAAFTVLGAVVAGALFLLGCLWLLDRAHPVRNAVVGLGVPLGLYLLFDTVLNAGLPAGVLPF
ncbi:tripartite tricarboxylate transporter TctB family protein [Pseudonocardia zijingensis]|uniref:DUF1468 domain-containing protein n=1 Tax=Pseudonocardia zijingensis TaxID=153376 RepID=A0ABP3YKP4_9PSEU